MSLHPEQLSTNTDGTAPSLVPGESLPGDTLSIRTSPIGSDPWEPDDHRPRLTALDQWLQGPEDAVPEQPLPMDPAGQAEVDRLRGELALIKARSALLRDPGWLDEPAPGERAADREAAARVRSMRRDQTLASAVAADQLNARARRADQRIARMDLADRLWSRRALARRHRLLDPTSRLAGLHRTHVASSAVLIGVAVAGIVWTAAGVHDALVGPNGNPLAYLVEPIFSLPLLVIMAVSAQAAQWDRAFPPPEQRTRVYALETFLLVATVAMNTVSVLPGVGTWHNWATLLAHLVPPVLIVIAVVLQPIVAGFLAGILTLGGTGTGPTADTAPVRLAPDTAHTLQLVAQVRTAQRRGELEIWADTGLPSISAIQRHLRCEKRRAQLVWDALRVLDGRGALATERRT